MTDLFAPPAPDPDVPCCMAAVVSNGDRCACWEPIRVDLDDLHQVDVDQLVAQVRDDPPSTRRCEGPPAIRPTTMCGDCAYRPGSPERQAADGDPPDYGPAERFYCHAGMPSVIAWWHPPTRTVSRVEVRAHYAPEMVADRAWRHDGRPGILCAGWAAHNRLPRPPRRDLDASRSPA